MWICKICRTMNQTTGACPRCGFDPGRDYETYATPAFFDCSSERSLKGLTERFLLSVDPDLTFCENCGGCRFYYSASSRKLVCCDCGKESVFNATEEDPLFGGIPVVPVSIGFNHVVGVKQDGTTIACGSNHRGQCDVGDFRTVRAVSAGFMNTLALREDGTVASAGFPESEAAEIDTWTDIVAVAAGKGFGAGLRREGTVCVSNTAAEYLKAAGSWKEIVSIAASGNSLYGVQRDGTVVSCRRDASSKRTSPILNWNDIAAVAVSEAFVFGRKHDGTVVSAANIAGTRIIGVRLEVSKWKDIQSISAGANHLVGLKNDGTVSAAALTEGAGFGLQTMTGWNGIRAISAGETYTIGIRDDGTLLIAGITTLDKQLSEWKDMLVPEKA